MTAGSLLNDLLTKPARALRVLGALQNHEECHRKVKSMPTWVNLSQGGSTLHSPEATEKKGVDDQCWCAGQRSTTCCVRMTGKEPCGDSLVLQEDKEAEEETTSEASG